MWLETLIVGVYCALLSRIVNTPFWFGCIKHALGYIIGLHSWFCEARRAGSKATVAWGQLASESMLEGVAVIVLSEILGRSMLAYFIMGVLLHVGSELSGFHRDFLKRCHI